jgi:maleylpyruvate isomerase
MVDPMTDFSTTLGWMADGTEFALGLVGGLSGEQLRGPSALPGWTRAHVVGHLARNAEALGRLAHWASTGIETPAYASRERRDADIEQSAGHPAVALRAELADTAVALASALDTLDPAAWSAQVRGPQGHPVPASALPWWRCREVWLHGVDLDAGAGLDALPPDVTDALLAGAAADMSGKPGCPGATLAPTDRDRPLTLGAAPADLTVEGTATQLLGWLVGRAEPTGPSVTRRGSTEPVPDLPRWL